MVALLAVGVAATGDHNRGVSPTGAATRPAATETPNSAGVVEEICRVASGGGTYYVNVTSLPGYKATACAGAQPFSGGIEDLLNLPGVDRRCILGTDHAVTSTHAVVSVYSDGNGPDVVAAQTFCRSHGGT